MVDPSLLDGKFLNEAGLDHLIELLGYLEPHKHGKAFMPLVRALGIPPTSVEVVIVQDGQVYLTYRDDAHFTGHHFPGGYIFGYPDNEEFEDTANRVAQRELGVTVEVVEVIGVVNHPKTERFHDVSVLLLCRVTGGELRNGEWFSEFPPDLLTAQEMYPDYIRPYMS